MELAGVVEGEGPQRLGRGFVVHQHQPPVQLDEIVRGASYPRVAGGGVGFDAPGQPIEGGRAALGQKLLADQRLQEDAPAHVLVGGRGNLQEQLLGDQLAGGRERGILAPPLADQHPDLARAEAAESPQVLADCAGEALLCFEARRPDGEAVPPRGTPGSGDHPEILTTLVVRAPDVRH